MEIPVIKEVTIPKISADDKTLSQIFSISVGHAGTVRREMDWFPKLKKGLQDNGRIARIDAFDAYLSYRGTREWKKEKSEIEKMKGNRK